MTKIRDEQLLIKFGNHLRELRQNLNMSQEVLANKADIPISQIGRIERGEVNASLSTLKVLALALEIPLPKLVDLK